MLNRIKDTLSGKAPLKKGRSSKWPKVRAEWLKENPVCAACGGSEKLEVHHIKPFHQNPELELDPTNLITLCEAKKYGIVCHRLVAHFGNYKHINPNVREDVLWFQSYFELQKQREMKNG